MSEVYAACVLVIDDLGDALGVSRRYNREDFGLPGGKVEPGEKPLQTAIRELYEETGLTAAPTEERLVFTREENNKLVVVYRFNPNEIVGQIRSTSEGEVRWVKPIVLTNGTFGGFNKALFQLCGILL